MPAAALAVPSAQTFFDAAGRPLSGAKAYFFVAETTTPLTVYTSAALSVAFPQPVLANANGRFPGIYVGDVSYRVRIIEPDGGLLDEFDGLQGAVPVPDDPTPVEPGTKMPTGSIVPMFDIDPISGWVRANGRTIGSASSGALEIADASAEDLFKKLWTVLPDTTATVSGGRGLSASADWTANKTITLPSLRGRGLRGRDNMGNGSPAGVITTATFTNVDQLGETGGSELITLTVEQLAVHPHTGSSASAGLHNHPGGSTTSDGSHQHLYDDTYEPSANNILVGGGAPVAVTIPGNVVDNRATTAAGTHSHAVGLPDSGTHDHDITIDEAGGDEPHNNMPPDMLVTFYIKL